MHVAQSIFHFLSLTLIAFVFLVAKHWNMTVCLGDNLDINEISVVSEVRCIHSISLYNILHDGFILQWCCLNLLRFCSNLSTPYCIHCLLEPMWPQKWSRMWADWRTCTGQLGKIGIHGEMLHLIWMFQGDRKDCWSVTVQDILELNKSPFIIIIYFPFTASLIYMH